MAAAPRRLDEREPGARRRREPCAQIHAGRHRDAAAGKAEHQLVDLLAAHAAPAFAHHVAHVAEHEQVAGQHSGRARDVLRRAGDEAAGEACNLAGRLRGFPFGGFDFCLQGGRDRHVTLGREREEALRELDVARAERFVDLARRHGGVEVAVELQFRQLHRIVGGRDLARRIDAAGQAHGRRQRKAQRERKRKGDGKAR